ncbi:MAG: hypothetical protein R2777_01060 [Chitinophagales bacterium]
MSTNAVLIMDTGLYGRRKPKQFLKELELLKELKIEKAVMNEKKEEGDWEIFCNQYEYIEEDYELQFHISFSGPFMYSIDIYEEIMVVYTFYRYRIIYESYNLYFFNDLREDLYAISKIFGATEMIWLADNATDISEYYELIDEKQISYKKIKNLLLHRFGAPVCNYHQLDYNRLRYYRLEEFIVDDFWALRKNPNYSNLISDTEHPLNIELAICFIEKKIDYAKVNILLSKGANFMAKNKYGEPIVYTILTSQLEIRSCSFFKYVSKNFKKRSLKRHVEIVKFIYQHNTNLDFYFNNYNLLIVAYKLYNYELLLFFLKIGLDPLGVNTIYKPSFYQKVLYAKNTDIRYNKNSYNYSFTEKTIKLYNDNCWNIPWNIDYKPFKE